MSEEKGKTETTPTTEEKPLPLAKKEEFHFLLVPEDGEPIMLDSSDFEQLKGEAYKALLAAGSGWAYFIINNIRCQVSTPRQIFTLRMPDGSHTELRDPAPAVFESNGKYRALVERPTGP